MVSAGTGLFRAGRTVPWRTGVEAYSQAASCEELLSGILKVAGPVLQSLLAGSQGGQASQNGSKPASAPPGANGAAGGGSALPGILTFLLKALLGGMQGAGGSVSASQSLLANGSDGNPFLKRQGTVYSPPLIFGVGRVVLSECAGASFQ